MGDLYEDLGVPRDEPGVIKRAYRKKAQSAHPDKGGDPEKFHAIQRAYDVLSDAARRERYDQSGKSDEEDEDSTLLSQIGQLVITLIDKLDVDHTNIIAEVSRTIAEGRQNAMSAIGQHEVKIKRRQRALKRLKLKKPGANIIAAIIESDIAANKSAINRAMSAAARYDRMLELLEGYEYASTPAPQMTAAEVRLRTITAAFDTLAR